MTKGNMINSPDFFFNHVEYENRGKKEEKKNMCPTQMADLKPNSSDDLYVAFRPYSFHNLPCPYRMAFPQVGPNSSDALSGVSCRIVGMVSS